MKAKSLIDLAALTGSYICTWLTRTTMVLGLLLLPFAIDSGLNFDSGSIAYGAPAKGGGGKPVDPGGGDGKGKPADPGSGGKPVDPGGGGGKPDVPGRGQGDLYSDLVVKYRSVQGLPIFVGVPQGEAEEGDEAPLAAGYVACEQPITGFPLLDANIDAYVVSTMPALTNPLLNPANGSLISPIPLGGTGVAGEECDVQSMPADFSAYLQEVHFGRLNIGRSPERVLRQQLRDVTAVLASYPSSELGWDSAGRITAGDFTVDSPLQSLAILKELLVLGDLESQTGSLINLPSLPWNETGMDYFDYAAAALGAAADKGYFDIAGLINLDLVVYNNRILDIPTLTNAAHINDVLLGNGMVGVAAEYYYDFSSYAYDRADKFPGCFEAITINGEVVKGTIMSMVFNDVHFSADDVFAFATAADDSRRMIAFTHETETIIVQKIDIAGKSDVCTAP